MSNHPGFRFPIPKRTMWMWSSLLITSQTLLLIRKWKLYFKLQEKCKLQGVRAKIPAEFCFPSMILFLTMSNSRLCSSSSPPRPRTCPASLIPHTWSTRSRWSLCRETFPFISNGFLEYRTCLIESVSKVDIKFKFSNYLDIVTSLYRIWSLQWEPCIYSTLMLSSQKFIIFNLIERNMYLFNDKLEIKLF